MGDINIASLPDELMDPPLLRSPLYSADAMVLLTPHLIDAIAGTIPEDAWDWTSTPISWISAIDPGSTGPQTLENVIIHDPSGEGSKRGYIVFEILTTEQTYFHELNIVKNVIQKKLVEMEILSSFSIKQIFDGMENLFQLHQLILTQLEEICSIDNWSASDSTIAHIFLEHKDSIHSNYIQYINNRQTADKTIEDQQEKFPKFKDFLIQCTKSRETKFTDLKELLLRPMQRMTRYPLLLRELEKRTPDNHPDKPLIKQAIETVSSIALAVNQKMEGIQHAHQLFQAFQQTLNCPPNLITEKRRCLLNIDAVDSRSVRYRLFLCSDLIMVVVYEGKRTMGVGSLLGNRPGGSGGSADSTAKQFRFLRWIDLLDIVDCEDTGNDFYKIRIDPERNPRSLSTLTGTNGVFPLTVEYKIDSVQPGAAQKRGEFIRTLQNEISHAAKVVGP
ncbi:Dbl homology domain-containing protein [Chytriomyces cf. hyalinus JEL632]|nr:Dbl homology domain-containing protein [Chytriomyces cf. hyalinus JEL632]